MNESKLLAPQHQPDSGSPILGIVLYEMVRYVSSVMGNLIYDLRVEGRHRFPQNGPVLLVANHQSHYDPVFIAQTTSRQIHWIARSTLFDNRVFAWMINSVHAIPMGQDKGDLPAVKIAIERLRRGEVVGIFPEGSRTADGSIDHFLRGTALLFKRAKVPVVPVAIEGAFNVWPRGRTLPRLRGKIRVRVGEAVSPEVLAAAGRDGALELLRERIAAMQEQLHDRLRHCTRGLLPQRLKAPLNRAGDRANSAETTCCPTEPKSPSASGTDSCRR